MNATTKAQHLIKSLNKAHAELIEAKKVMHDADISSAIWAEIEGIENNTRAVIIVLEANENAK